MHYELRASFVPFAALMVGAPFERPAAFAPLLHSFPKGLADGLRWPTYFEEHMADASCDPPSFRLS